MRVNIILQSCYNLQSHQYSIQFISLIGRQSQFLPKALLHCQEALMASCNLLLTCGFQVEMKHLYFTCVNRKINFLARTIKSVKQLYLIRIPCENKLQLSSILYLPGLCHILQSFIPISFQIHVVSIRDTSHQVALSCTFRFRI